MYTAINVIEGSVSRIQLNRPDKRNAMSFEMINELYDAFVTLDKDDECKVIILEGNGKGFCAGGDLSSMGAEKNIIDDRNFNKALAKLLNFMTTCGKIIIAKIHGFAMAGGFGLAVTADITIITDDVKIGVPEILRGLFPFMISAPISRAMPWKKMTEIMFVGSNITPQEAVDYGIANYAAPSEEIDDFTNNIAEKISKHSSMAIRLGKESLYSQRDMTFRGALEYLSDNLTIIMGTDDSKEGIQAFFEKRNPEWKNK